MNLVEYIKDTPIDEFIRLRNQIRIDLRKREDKMRLSDLIRLIEQGKQPKVIEETYKVYDSKTIYKWYVERFDYCNDYGNSLFDKLTLEETIKYSTFRIIKEKEILDKEEKEYLCNIIKPFRNEVHYICKNRLSGNKFYIQIDHKNCYIDLPSFEASTNMYKNMEANREYTLEELGL